MVPPFPHSIKRTCVWANPLGRPIDFYVSGSKLVTVVSCMFIQFWGIQSAIPCGIRMFLGFLLD
jgi:hypothetical protein